MNSVHVWWAISAVVLIVAAGWAGRASRRNILGILLDSRGRYSLTQLQIVLWTIVVLSLLAGVFLARLFERVAGPLNITIPNELLIVMGISVGSTAAATAIKTDKDARGVGIRGRNAPRFAQVYLVEEGSGPEVVDVTKFQNFWLTLIAVGAYVAMTVAEVATGAIGANPYLLPGFDGTLVTILGISHAGYLAGKLPDRQ